MNPTLQIVPIFPTPIGYVNKGADIHITPREGLFILFPASLEHFVTPLVKFEEKRYSISFVADIK